MKRKTALWIFPLLAFAPLACQRQEPAASMTAPAVSSPASADDPAASDPRFTNHPPGEAFAGTPAQVDVASHPSARTFEPLLRAGAAGGPNFSGHLTLVSMDCGTNCQGWMVVDARTGRVYDGFTSSVGAEFRKDSGLVIVNPPEKVTPSCKCATELYAWRGERLEKIE